MTIDHGEQPTAGEPQLWQIFEDLEQGGPAVPPTATEDTGSDLAINEANRNSDGMPPINKAYAGLGTAALGPPIETTTTEVPERQTPHSRRKVWLAVGAAAVVLAAGVTGGITAAEKSSGRPTAVAQKPGTPGALAPTLASPTPEQSVPKVTADQAPIVILSDVVKPGNIDLSQPYKGLKEFREPWNGGTAILPPILRPESFYGPENLTDNTIQKTANEFLANLQYLWGADPTSQEFADVLGRMTNDDSVKATIISQNAILRIKYPNSQFIFFDTADEPSEAAPGGFNAAQFPTVNVNQSGGKLYLRVLSNDCRIANGECVTGPGGSPAVFSDPRALGLGDAAPVDVSFAYDGVRQSDDLAHAIVNWFSITINTSGNNGFFATRFPISGDSTGSTTN